MSQAADRVSVRRAAIVLRVCEDHIRLLIRKGKLESTGRGLTRGITVASIERYRSKQRKTDMWPKKTDISVPISVALSHKQRVAILKELLGRIERLITEPGQGGQ